MPVNLKEFFIPTKFKLALMLILFFIVPMPLFAGSAIDVTLFGGIVWLLFGDLFGSYFIYLIIVSYVLACVIAHFYNMAMKEEKYVEY